ncbi:InlB B-repeat-containing protein [Paenibacillus sp. YYML68]|uniref:InlB B-repeat-containing protein n=1 Tax=Paenibacillus sp. YYML68 TaxID=2909250 RepID=UPI0024937474|nr:InlB B-repeat-containing protein [Paenibacillus sp. YYML68]
MLVSRIRGSYLAWLITVAFSLLLAATLVMPQQASATSASFTRGVDPFPDVQFDLRIVFGDFDHDGDIDALSQSNNVMGQGYVFTRRNSDGTFTNFSQVGTSIPDSPFASVDLSGLNGTGGFYGANTIVLDYDQDGDVDIISRSAHQTGGANFLLRNDNGVFTRVADPFPDVQFDSRIEFGDFDNDGDIDALAQDGNVVGQGYIYSRRNADGTYATFNQVGTSIPGTPFATVDLTGMNGLSFFVVDYDNDGDADIVSRSGSHGGSNFILRNDNGASFTRIADPFVDTLFDLRMTFGDFDNDGDVDALQQEGNTAGAGYIFMRREANGSYTRFDQVGVSIPSTPFSSVDLSGLSGSAMYTIDYDSDGDLDIINRSGTNFVLRSAGSPPSLVSSTPANGATNIAVGSNIVMELSEVVTAGSGNLYVRKSSDHSIVETIAVSSGKVTVSGTTITVNPDTTLEGNTSYYITFDLNAFVDSDLQGFGYLDEFARRGYDKPYLLRFTTAASVQYTVTYNGNGHTGGNVPLDGGSYASGATATVLGNTGTLERTGYTFAGWNTASDGTGTDYAGGATLTVSGNVTLYAKWTADSYTVTYAGNGSTGGTAPAVVTQSYNSTVTVSGNTGTLSRTGYTFAGWNTASDGTGTDYAGGATFALTGNVTLYAKWTADSYTVTYAGNGSTGGTAPAVVTQSYNSTVTVSGNTGTLVRTGYTFGGWNTAADGTGTDYAGGATFTLTGNVTLYAKWTADSYTVTYDGNGSTGGTAPAVVTQSYNSTVTVSGNTGALIRTGYTFAGWNTASDGSGTDYAGGATFALTGNVTLYAKWTADSYTVTYDGNGSTGGTAPAVVTQSYNSTVTVSGNTGTLVRTGYTFAGWNTASDGSGTDYAGGATFTLVGNVTLYAKWTADSYTVTYAGNGSTGGTAPAVVTQSYNSTVTVSGNIGSLVRTGYSFAGWNTASDGSGTDYAGGATFTLTGNVTLYAKWTADSYTVTYDGNGSTGGTAPAVVTQSYNSTVTVSGNTGTLVRTGYTFAGWNTASDGSGTDYAGGATFTLTGNVTLYAKWTADSYTVTYDGNGSTGGTAPAVVTQSYNSTVTVSGNTGTLVRTGYTFAGWNTASDGSGTDYAGGATFALTGNVTLYAKWTADSYTVTYAGNGSTGGTAPAVVTQSYNSTVTVSGNTGALVRTGYTFAGWNTAADGSGTDYVGGATFTLVGNVTLYAKWTADSYTVTYDGNGSTGGTAPAVVTQSYNSTVTVSGNTGTLVRTGYTFAGWNTASDVSGTDYEGGATFTLTGNVTLYAKWTADSYTVTYDGNGSTGGTAPAVVTQSYNSTVTVSGNTGTLVRTGYTFAGWNTASDGSGTDYAGGATFALTGNVTLYAKWTADSYTVTYAGNGSTGGTAPAVVTQSYNSTVTVSGNTGVLVRTGYSFAGWNTAADGSGTDYAGGATFALTGNVTLYAKWTADSYTVTYAGNGSTGGTAPAVVTQSYNSTVTVSGNTGTLSRTGYSFAGWNTAADGTGTDYAGGATFTLVGNVTLYAKWTADSYTVTYDGNGSTGGTAPAVVTQSYNSTVTVSGNTGTLVRTGYTFAGWNTAADGTGTDYAGGATFTLVGNVTLYAKWTADSYTVTYDGNGSTGGTVPAVVTQSYNSTVTVSGNTGTLVRTGYSFAGWNTAADGTGTDYAGGATFTLVGNVTLYAKWTADSYTVTYDGNGSTGGTAPAMVTQSYNSTVTVSGNTGVLVRTGYTFAGWNTAADGTGTDYAADATFTLTGNVTLYAKWTADSYTVTYAGNGSTGGTAPAVVTQSYNSTVTVSGNTGALVRTGYTFAGWNTASDGSGTDYAANVTFTLTGNVTLYAKWTADSHTVTYDGNGSTGGTVPAVVTQSYNSTVTVSGNTGALVRTGYTFAGWNTAADGTGTDYAADATFTLSGNVTLYAKWTINTYTLTYTAGANGQLVGAAVQSVSFGGSGTAVTAVPDTGYTFTGWSDGLQTATRTDAQVASNLQVTASFADLTPPGTVQLQLSHTTWTSADVTATLTGEPDATIEYRIEPSIVWLSYSGPVTLTEEGNYLLYARQRDLSGNVSAEIFSRVQIDKTKPMIQLNGDSSMNLYVDSAYVEPGAVVTDNITSQLQATITGSVDTANVGSYTLRYNAVDAAGNAAEEMTRTVHVMPKPIGLYFDSTSYSVSHGSTVPFSLKLRLSDHNEVDVTAKSQYTFNVAGVAGIVAPGTITGQLPGTAVVNAVYGQQPASATIVVNAVLSKLEFSPTELTIKEGSTASIALEGTYSDGSTADVTAAAQYQFSPDQVAELESSGKVKGRMTGATVLQATYGNLSTQLQIQVTKSASQELEDALKALTVGYASSDSWESVTQNVTLPTSGLHDVSISWSSSQPGIVSSTGQVTRSLSGDTVILLTATAMQDGVEAKRTFLLVVKQANLFVLGESSRTVPIRTGEGSVDVEQTTIVRKSWSDGTHVDKAKLDPGKIQSALNEALNSNKTSVRVVVTDLPEAPADEVAIEAPAAAYKPLAGKTDLSLETDGASVIIPKSSLTELSVEGQDLFFRFIPIRKQAEVAQVTREALNDQRVKQEAGQRSVSYVGTPMSIETNYRAHATKLLFPLSKLNAPSGTAAQESYLAKLYVYIEHSDGDIDLKKAAIERDSTGGIIGLSILINKFSTFTILKMDTVNPSNDGSGSGDGTTETPAKNVDPKQEPEEKPSDANKLKHYPYVQGYAGGFFQPEKTTTRAELASMLWRILLMEGEQAKQAVPSSYLDVPSSHWAVEAIEGLRAKGIMLGVGEGSFQPDRAITRAEFAVLAVRWKQLRGTEPAAVFSDLAGHWAEESIRILYAAGVVNGYDGGVFQPDAGVTRAEMVKMLNRLLKRGPLTGVQAATWQDVSASHWAFADIEEASREHRYELNSTGEERLLPE